MLNNKSISHEFFQSRFSFVKKKDQRNKHLNPKQGEGLRIEGDTGHASVHNTDVRVQDPDPNVVRGRVARVKVELLPICTGQLRRSVDLVLSSLVSEAVAVDQPFRDGLPRSGGLDCSEVHCREVVALPDRRVVHGEVRPDHGLSTVRGTIVERVLDTHALLGVGDPVHGRGLLGSPADALGHVVEHDVASLTDPCRAVPSRNGLRLFLDLGDDVRVRVGAELDPLSIVNVNKLLEDRNVGVVLELAVERCVERVRVVASVHRPEARVPESHTVLSIVQLQGDDWEIGLGFTTMGELQGDQEDLLVLGGGDQLDLLLEPSDTLIEPGRRVCGQLVEEIHKPTRMGDLFLAPDPPAHFLDHGVAHAVDVIEEVCRGGQGLADWVQGADRREDHTQERWAGQITGTVDLDPARQTGRLDGRSPCGRELLRVENVIRVRIVLLFPKGESWGATDGVVLGGRQLQDGSCS